MIKLIASDVDGTLLKDGSQGINPRLFEVILELKNRGIVFTACSGRSITSLKNTFKPVVDDIILCGENGGNVICRDYTIFTDYMKKDDIYKLIEESRKIGNLLIALCCSDVMHIEGADEYDMKKKIEGYKTNINFVDDITKCDLNKVIKFSILDKKGLHNNALYKFNRIWWDKLFVTEAGNEWLDFTNKDITKGRAIEEIQYFLDISKDETMVFGDNHNDLPMLDKAKYSFAVKNARKEVIEKANYIAASYEEDGVLKILEKVLLGDFNF